MNTLAVIPARGGSKGIARKNLALLCGRPLLSWMIDAARSARRVDRVVVSTDDAEIGQCARHCGADVVVRPAEISGDGASSESALLHCLDHLRREEDYRPDVLALLQCTAPLTLGEDIDGTIAALIDTGADSGLAVADFHHFLWRDGDAGSLVGVNHDAAIRLPRQARTPDLLESGSVYVMRTKGFLRTKHRFYGTVASYCLPRERCWEIDEAADLVVAEALLRRRQQSRRADLLPPALSAVVLDFDGVMTDNRALVLQDGREAVLCNRSDGLAIASLKANGVMLLVLSSEANPVVRARCDKLGVECLHGVGRKWPVLEEWLANRKIEPAHVVYVGNDVNDLECLQSVGCGVAVADSHKAVRSAARIVLDTGGGNGAVRELADLIELVQKPSGTGSFCGAPVRCPLSVVRECL